MHRARRSFSGILRSAAHSPVVVRDVDVTPGTLHGLKAAHDVTFVDCRFVSFALAISSCRLVACEVSRPIRFIGCTFQASLSIAGTASIDAPIVFEMCDLRQLEVKFDGSETPVDHPNPNPFKSRPLPACVRMDQCELRQTVDVSMPTGRALEIVRSTVHVASQVTTQVLVLEGISTSEPRWSFNLEESHVAGRLRIRTVNLESERPGTESDEDGIVALDLAGAVITGTVDMDEASILSVNLLKTEVAGGELKLRICDFVRSESAWLDSLGILDYAKPLPLRSYDFLIPLPVSHRHAMENQELLTGIREQYTELRDSYSRLGNRSEEYDYCAFKVASLGVEIDRLKLAIESNRISSSDGFLWGTTVLFAAAFIPCFIESTQQLIVAESVLLILANCALFSRYPRHMALRWVRLWFLKAVVENCFDHGIRTYRPIVAAFCFIFLCAILFGACTVTIPGTGAITRTDGTGLTVDLLGRPWASGVSPVTKSNCDLLFDFASVFPESLYFSTVTFTTLGYGDYQPKGRLMVLASVEASIGVLMIAMVTVIFARRYLRL